MATKWKNMMYKLNTTASRKTAPAVLALSIAVFIFALGGMMKFSLSPSNLAYSDPFETPDFYWKADYINDLLVELSQLGTEEQIKSGKHIGSKYPESALISKSKDIAVNYIESAGYDYNYHTNEIRDNYNWEIQTGTITINTQSHGTINILIPDYPSDFIFSSLTEDTPDRATREIPEDTHTISTSLSVEQTYEAADETIVENTTEIIQSQNPIISEADFLKKYNLYTLNEFLTLFTYTEAAEYYMQRDLEEYYNCIGQLDTFDGLVYKIAYGSGTPEGSSLQKGQFYDLPFYYITTSISAETNADSLSYRYMAKPSNSQATIMFGFETPAYNVFYNNWLFGKTAGFIFMAMIFIALAGILSTLAYLFILWDKPVNDIPVNANSPQFIDYNVKNRYLYTDLSFFAGAGLFVLSLVTISNATGKGRYYLWYDHSLVSRNQYFTVSFIIAGILIAVIAGSILSFILISYMTDIKKKQFLRHSIAYKFWTGIQNTFYNIFNRIPVGYKLISARKLRKVKAGIDRIQQGDYNTPIEIRGNGHMAQLARGINDISVGFNIAVENRLKSERMKTELISNVSHDIRTPLTSIITYVDLLKKEGNTPEETAKYLDVLENKTARLKILIDDLFEASKVSSGNIASELVPTDIGNVLDQAMGELEDKIEASGLTFKVNLPAQHLYAMADGKLLWRIINNLFSNIFKYSMPLSRVYIDLFEENDKVMLTFKNMSAYELNISTDELMERFTRGDKSRNSEGSGLGLNIANSLVQLMGGSFDITLDGDLFKVTITLNKVYIN